MSKINANDKSVTPLVLMLNDGFTSQFISPKLRQEYLTGITVR